MRKSELNKKLDTLEAALMSILGICKDDEKSNEHKIAVIKSIVEIYFKSN